VPPQTEAIEVEPFDSMISLVMRTAYGYSASGTHRLDGTLGERAVADFARPVP